MARRFRICSFRRQKAFTYVGLLIAVVFFGLGSVGAARILASSERGEREAELLFVGNQFRQAIGSYYHAGPGVRRYPERLEDLLFDQRVPVIKRHLRKIFVDPITAQAEWGLIKAPEGGIMGVYSLSTREPLKRAGFDFANQSFQDAANSATDRSYTYQNWQFVFVPAVRQ